MIFAHSTRPLRRRWVVVIAKQLHSGMGSSIVVVVVVVIGEVEAGDVGVSGTVVVVVVVVPPTHYPCCNALLLLGGGGGGGADNVQAASNSCQRMSLGTSVG